jgi:hypothetical protein
MNYLSEAKDPAETITVDFDFSAVTSTPTSPTVSVSVRLGTEAIPSLLASGSPVISGAIVRQRFTGGADLNDYNLKCLATTPSGDRLSVDCVLPVRNRPV